jgi:hypothetical protein
MWIVSLPPLRPERREVLPSMAMTSSGALVSAPTHATKRSRKALPEGLGVERSEDVAQVVVARRAVREGQKALQKGELLLPEPSHVREPLGARQDRQQSQQQNLVEPIGHLARLPMVRHVFEIIEKNSGLEIRRRRRRQNIHRPAPLTNQRMPTDSALQPFVTNFLHPIALERAPSRLASLPPFAYDRPYSRTARP